jgi:hypothetical protein
MTNRPAMVLIWSDAQQSATALAAAALLCAPTAAAANQTISGSVTCINPLQQNTRPVGMWVDTNTQDGWATLSSGIGATGAWTSNYKFTANNAGQFTLNVGCGGTQQSWGSTIKQGPFGPGTKNLTVRFWCGPGMGAC